MNSKVFLLAVELAKKTNAEKKIAKYTDEIYNILDEKENKYKIKVNFNRVDYSTTMIYIDTSKVNSYIDFLKDTLRTIIEKFMGELGFKKIGTIYKLMLLTKGKVKISADFKSPVLTIITIDY